MYNYSELIFLILYSSPVNGGGFFVTNYMKKIILSAICLTLVFTAGFAQKTKAEKEALGLALFAKAQAAVEAKDFVIVPDQYQTSTGSQF